MKRLRLLFAAAIIVSSRVYAQAPEDKAGMWALPQFTYFEAGGHIMVTGTLKGAHVGYPVNTWSIDCDNMTMTCRVASVEAIGKDHLGRIAVSDWPISKWADKVVVAESPPDPSACSRAVLSFDRAVKKVSYTSIPQNHDKNYCRIFKDDGVYTWDIGDPVQPWDAQREKGK